MPNPEAAYELCKSFVPDCDQPLPMPPAQQGDDGSLASYRGIAEDELLAREGVSPQQYLEFTETVDEAPPPVNDTVVDDLHLLHLGYFIGVTIALFGRTMMMRNSTIFRCQANQDCEDLQG